MKALNEARVEQTGNGPPVADGVACPWDQRESLRKSLIEQLNATIRKSIDRLLSDQHADGHWIYELEADCTIPAEYICYLHYMDDRDPVLEQRLGRYLLQNQMSNGAWPLFHGGIADISCTVKAYYALKLSGHDPQSEPMRRAREWILANGGAAKTNVFTRILLAWFEQVPWTAVPYMPAEIVLLPRRFFFSLDKVSYWSRTVMVPLLILYSLRARAANPTGLGIAECFVEPPGQVRQWFEARSGLNRAFLWLEALGRRADRLVPRSLHTRAIKRAESWFVDRLNGGDGLGAIFPAMVNASIALKELGYAADHPLRVQTREALDALLVDRGDSTYCQPCVSPVWDTGLAALALDTTGEADARSAARRGLDWLAQRQLSDEPGDWRRTRPDLPGGGWAFQYNNGHYPDLDDTAMVVWAMQQHDSKAFRASMDRAATWLTGMQSSNGGFGAFDVDNHSEYLNHIPFADHGALLDPPTADVTARCLTMYALLDDPRFQTARDRARAWLLSQQEHDGSWFGRWGTNYVYGTWSALVALGSDADARNLEAIERGASWLRSCQHHDGGWGEGNDSYHDDQMTGRGSCSRAFQTGWALLGLVAAGHVGSDSVERGVRYLCRTQSSEGDWPDPWFTAPGFPRVFYLKYHGYSRYFPLWALAAARNAWHGQAPDRSTGPSPGVGVDRDSVVF
ncbi:MAG: squalene--hopene cyclase [Wenzhouxiangellaceae bacterium]|nr:squalene--hopene cyclase [Wenzhouxiangellaceae bacterium]